MYHDKSVKMIFHPIHKLDRPLEQIDFSVYGPLLRPHPNRKVGDAVEFIYEDDILIGQIERLVDDIRSVVRTEREGLFVVLNNKFLKPIDEKLFQCEGGKVDFKKIRKEFADKELAEAEEESRAMWEEAIAQEQPDLNLATADNLQIAYPFAPSIYQQKILDGLKSRHQQLEGLGSQLKSMVIEALAGCAKSSTMVLIAVFLKHNSYKAAHCRFVVFGKANQEDLKNKIETATGKPSWGNAVQTLHGFAFEIWRGKDKVKEKVKDYDIDEKKYETIAKNLGAIAKGNKPGDLDKTCESAEFLELVDKLRIYCVREITPDTILAIAERCQIISFLTENAEILKKAALWSQRVLSEGLKIAVESKKIDYTDMLWLLWKEQKKYQGIIEKWRGKLKFIGVDESQDLNLLQIEVLKILHNPQTNFFCFVGDRWQAIYGFRGSESNCMDILQDTFGCDRFDLPLNFRCGKNHLDFVRQLFPHIKIEAREDAPLGEIRCIKDSDLPQLLKKDSIPTFGIGRRNASLVGLAIRLALKGVSVKFKDALVARKIYNVVRSAVTASKQPYDPETFEALLRADTKVKIAKLPERNRQMLELEVRDLAKCCYLIFQQYQIASMGQWDEVLQQLFESQETNVAFHTIHSGKGGEGDRVLFVYPDDTPLTYLGQTDEEKQQERNAIYIALTRCLAKGDRVNSGVLWLVIQQAIEKGKLVYKWPGWLPQEMRRF